MQVDESRQQTLKFGSFGFLICSSPYITQPHTQTSLWSTRLRKHGSLLTTLMAHVLPAYFFKLEREVPWGWVPFPLTLLQPMEELKKEWEAVTENQKTVVKPMPAKSNQIQRLQSFSFSLACYRWHLYPRVNQLNYITGNFGVHSWVKKYTAILTLKQLMSPQKVKYFRSSSTTSQAIMKIKLFC